MRRLWAALLVVCVLVQVGLADQMHEWLTWKPVGDVEGVRARHGGAAGIVDGMMLIVGGVESTAGDVLPVGAGQYFSDVLMLQVQEGSSPELVGRADMGDPWAYAAAVSTEYGVICAGGEHEAGVATDTVRLFRLQAGVDTSEGLGIDIVELPALPAAVRRPTATVDGEYVYVAGVAEGGSRLVVWSLAYGKAIEGDGVAAWQALPGLDVPGLAATEPAVICVQNDGWEDCVFVFVPLPRAGDDGGKSASDAGMTAVYSFSRTEGAWRAKASFSQRVEPIAAVGQGHSYIIVIGNEVKDNDGRYGSALGYHTITDTWGRMGTLPEGLSAEQVVRYGQDVFVLEESLGDTAGLRIARADLPSIRRPFGVVNYLVLGVYLAGLVGMGFYFSCREKTTEDFFLGGRRVPWWAAGISIFGTQLSAITFMAIPAKVYATDWLYFVGNISIVLVVAPVVVFVFIPFYRRLNVTTAYEYLEKRFNVEVRLAASLAYILLQIGRMGVVIYLPAIALSTVTGIGVPVCIMAMGILCIVYTVLGGIEAVIWTDVLQVIVLLGGALLCLAMIIFGVEGGLGEVVSVGMAEHKFRMVDVGVDLRTTSLLVVLLWCMSFLVPYTSDQTVIQRYLTTKDEQSAARSMWVSAIIAVPASVLFFGLGTALYVFYKTHHDALHPNLSNDSILPWFIVQELPAGLSGLLIAGVFAAAMSSLDSSMNSAATAITTDFVRRFRPDMADAYCLKLARWLVVVLGIIGTGTALLMAGSDIKSLWDQFSRIIGLFGGGLAGLFMLAAFTRRAHGWGALVGLLLTAPVMYYVQSYTPLHFFLYATIGMANCFVLGYVFSLLLPSERRSLEGLTVHTLYANRR